jgi:hypothetical protein
MIPDQFMKDHIKSELVGANGHKHRFVPGNGTVYEIFVTPVGDLGLGAMGHVTNGYLVVNGFNGRAMLIQPEGYLTADYVHEKLFPEQGGTHDWYAVTALIGYVTNRPHNVTLLSTMGVEEL